MLAFTPWASSHPRLELGALDDPHLHLRMPKASRLKEFETEILAKARRGDTVTTIQTWLLEEKQMKVPRSTLIGFLHTRTRSALATAAAVLGGQGAVSANPVTASASPKAKRPYRRRQPLATSTSSFPPRRPHQALPGDAFVTPAPGRRGLPPPAPPVARPDVS